MTSLHSQIAHWIRCCPKMTLKTCLFVVGPLLWLLYLLSTNYIYANNRNLQTAIQPSAHPIAIEVDGQILRRPTVPVFEGADDAQLQLQSIMPTNSTEEFASENHVKTDFRTNRHGDFTFLIEAIKRNKEYDREQSITLTTHATYELLDNLINLSHHWMGPISVAVYAPNIDFKVAFEYSLWLRHCYRNVADYVTFHFVYPHEDGEKIKLNQSPKKSASSNVTVIDQLQIANELIVKYLYNLSVNCKDNSFALPTSYRHQHAISYPINVCRNLARKSATTYFVLASDIELYPSANVIPMFLSLGKKLQLFPQNFTQQQNVNNKISTGIGTITISNIFSSTVKLPSGSKPKKVFVLPIFEVDKSAKRVPTSKKDLVQLYRERKVVYFHKHVCSFCNIIPRLNKWLTSRIQPGVLDVFMTVKRHRPFNRWEPIYIGTNDDPLYDERFTWEGQQDKMSQVSSP
ncbi:hypothetical protein CHUAL_003500 [Chamberlinius hualienensis]